MEFGFTQRMTPSSYERFLNAGFRRSGQMIYRPSCKGCQECQPIRILAQQFRPDRSMRRCWRANQDLVSQMGPPLLSTEKTELYQRYISTRHDKEDPAGPEDFLYLTPVESREVEFRLDGELVSVAIVDTVPSGLSAVYTFFAPEQATRGLGTYAVLWEIEYCRQHDLPYVYLGYYIRDSRKMNYKTRFQQYQIRQHGGEWI